jgi:hypothetical protein
MFRKPYQRANDSKKKERKRARTKKWDSTLQQSMQSQYLISCGRIFFLEETGEGRILVMLDWRV